MAEAPGPSKGSPTHTPTATLVQLQDIWSNSDHPGPL